MSGGGVVLRSLSECSGEMCKRGHQKEELVPEGLQPWPVTRAWSSGALGGVGHAPNRRTGAPQQGEALCFVTSG